MTLPAERLSALNQIASVLWSVAWRYEGNKGPVPVLTALSKRNQRRWLGAALACEHLIVQAKQDSVQQSAVINACIKVLEKYRDENAKVEIA